MLSLDRCGGPSEVERKEGDCNSEFICKRESASWSTLQLYRNVHEGHNSSPGMTKEMT